MFKSYTEIYETRGGMYHDAMAQWPKARKQEFEALVQSAEITAEVPVIVDVPSGGGYISDYLPAGSKLISVDPSARFLHAGGQESAHQVICAPHAAIPLPDASVDVVLSLAGLHHLDDHQSAFAEWFRLLRPGGVLVIGDGLEGSATTQFLDEVVGRFNSMGHTGNYLSSQDTELLESIGFDLVEAAEKPYSWVFADRSAMLEFCRTLFCMDRAVDDAVLVSEIERTVGFYEGPGECHLRWALMFITARKPAAGS
ncbi:MAG: class I SAM-dependent methyltransferase [Coraliomargarita sp.]